MQLNLFPAGAPVEDISIDLLTKLHPLKRGFTNLWVITDRYKKLVRVVSIKITNAFQSAREFTLAPLHACPIQPSE